MGLFIVKRLLWIFPVMLGIAILIFTIMYICPGDPAAAILGIGATQIQIDQKRAELGLNQPYIVQLLQYLKQVFLELDLGTSYFYRTPVIDGLMSRMHYTLILALTCMALQILIGTPLGIMAATHRNGLADRFCMIVALAGVSIPGFWFALMMVVFFSVKLGWLPTYGVGGIQYYIMPCIANSFAGIATQARQTRSSMLEVIHSDYISTALAKGLSDREILFKHALPNALIPIITVVGNGMGMMLGGAVVVENVFSIPGIGNYMMSAINSRDYPIVLGGVLVLGIVFSLIMLMVDIIYAFVDPR
ncbi:MAG: ABC transporter permease, partial [Clostridiales bacterium]|nr:ABC transporter permease [Clostridiales bacterium]